MKEDFRSVEFAPGKTISVETGRIAKLADGAVMVRMGDTMVLCTVVSAKESKPGQDFFPLVVDLRESFTAAGKFPGGFMKREGRPSDGETLASRLIDRSLRPLFPYGYYNETQVICQVFSSDGQNQADVLGGFGASASIHLSDIPFDGPMAQVKVGRIDGEFVINPTVDELKKSDMDMIVAGTADSVLMIEGEMKEISEKEMLDAVKEGHKAIVKLCEFQDELRKEFGLEKREFTAPEGNTELKEKVAALTGNKIDQILEEGLGKEDFNGKLRDLKTEIKEAITADEAYEEAGSEISSIFGDLVKDAVRNRILEKKKRIDGRTPEEIRPIWTQVGYLPRVHGSAIFSRGETQALISVALGTKRDAQSVDTLFYEGDQTFMLHYNFPPYCVGEAGFMRGPGRREIGHGHLAERALKMVLPDFDDFGYVIRVRSDITESNGSSSMASVCGGSLAMMDAGVPIPKPVAGIAMGMILGENNAVVLSDIQGEEDFMGDMDFKTAGTADGITATQMDMKVKGISFEMIEKALEQAHTGRLHILDKMAETISETRETLSPFAPQFIRMTIDGDNIGAVIGPGGKVIQTLQKETDTEIWIEEDAQGKGQITISADSLEKAENAKKRIQAIAGDLDEGTVYKGTVKAIKEYGAFVEIVPGKEGLLHISELEHGHVKRVEDVIAVGDEIEVKLLKVEHGGKLRLSRKALLPKEEE
ncbi:MAG: polyribonucleotide nucleotidyltransferase [Balneolaceae bacterium]|nr:MAG: polyribonucleotide nucleotidyltransferase [Balneolaceae bacterium]